MSWYYLRQEEPKARKVHKCLLCGEDIEIGEKYILRTGVDNRELILMRMHKECEYQASSGDDEDWECFDRYSMERPVRGE